MLIGKTSSEFLLSSIEKRFSNAHAKESYRKFIDLYIIYTYFGVFIPHTILTLDAPLDSILWTIGEVRILSSRRANDTFG